VKTEIAPAGSCLCLKGVFYRWITFLSVFVFGKVWYYAFTQVKSSKIVAKL